MAKKMTIEQLAAMIQKTMASKEDLKSLATKEDLKDVWEEVNATHADVRHIRSTVDTLIHSDVAQEAAIEDLTSRVHRLEEKASLAK